MGLRHRAYPLISLKHCFKGYIFMKNTSDSLNVSGYVAK
jgi:hypothetical protein